MVGGEILETFCDEIRDTILDIGNELLKTDNFQVHIESLQTEGDFQNLLIPKNVQSMV